MYVKHYKILDGYKRNDGYAPLMPQQISIKITNLCNLRCKTCGQWGETGYNLTTPPPDVKEVVATSHYMHLCDDVKALKPIYYIWGGEPFLYPGLFDVTHRIKKNGSPLALVTNATLLKDHVRTAIEQRWDAIMFSLDGPEDIHDEIRGRNGTFQKVIEGIENLRRYRSNTNSVLPWIMALVTISVDNAGSLDKIFEIGKQLKIDCMIVYYSWFTNETIGRAHSEIMQKYLGTTPTKWQGYLFSHHLDTTALIECIRRIRSIQWDFPYLFIPDLKNDQQIVDYYNKPHNFFGYGPCISPWFVTEVMPNGDVSPCRDYSDYIVGNIMEQSIAEMWNNQAYREFRCALKENGGVFPICARCCGLMGW